MALALTEQFGHGKALLTSAGGQTVARRAGLDDHGTADQAGHVELAGGLEHGVVGLETAICRPSGRRTIIGAAVAVPSLSRMTVAATIRAAVGRSTSRAVSTAEASMPAWASRVSPRW